MKKRWILGTRGSKLALTQTGMVVAELRSLYPEWEFTTKIIKTTGDTIWDKPIHTIGEKGLFVKEIEEALEKGEIDLAVHSMKDLPTGLPSGLVIAAVLKREDPRDALLSRSPLSFDTLKQGARIGTNSLRRKSQILHCHPGVKIIPIRGNVDTRIRKMDDLDLQAIVLALAGIRRMGYEDSVRDILSLDILVPPSGQGAIGVESRDEAESIDLLKPLDHRESRKEVETERLLQTMIGGGCSVPLGINACIGSGELVVRAAYSDEQGLSLVRVKESGPVETAAQIVKRAFEGLNITLQQ
ncbi:MAG TPA: hydroxymethylbilane synthase [Syntrophorhabdaceae bacterium]